MNDSARIVGCSSCFKDFGLRRTAESIGTEDPSPCATCNAADGRKLTFGQIEDVCRNYFVQGSIPSGRGISAPVIQFNDREGESDIFGSPELRADVAMLKQMHGLTFFIYGPPLWRFGKPPDSSGTATWEDSDIDFVLNHCADLVLDTNQVLYRTQLNLADHEIVASRFCSPPSHVRRTLGRFDSSDLTVCYTASDIETCIHESRVTLQDYIFVAVLTPTRSLRLLNLSDCSATGASPFEDPAIWLDGLIFNGSDSYDTCRRLARRISERNYDGFLYTSYFQQATNRKHQNVALFGSPIRSNLLSVASIDRVFLSNVAYEWGYGPATGFAEHRGAGLSKLMFLRSQLLATAAIAGRQLKALLWPTR